MSFKLINIEKNFYKSYEIISKNIPSSIFAVLGFSFFKYLISKKIIKIYLIVKKKKISALISVINYENYFAINRKIIIYLALNPLKLFMNLIKILSAVTKNSKFKINKNYLHLLHLIIFKKDFLHVSLKEKDKIINNFYKKILKKNKSNTFFLCFEKANSKAYRYYLRNKFKLFYKIGNLLYFKKKYKI